MNTGGMRYMDSFWRFSPAAAKPSPSLVNRIRVWAEDLPTACLFDANTLRLKRKLWHGEADFGSRFTANMSFATSNMINEWRNHWWEWIFFLSDLTHCKPYIAQWASYSSEILMILWIVWKVLGLELPVLSKQRFSRTTVIVEQVVFLPNLYWKVSVNSSATRYNFTAQLLRVVEQTHM